MEVAKIKPTDPFDADGERDAGSARLSDLFASLVGMVRRRIVPLIAVSVLTMTVLSALVWMMTPQYEAVARLRIDPSRNPLAGQRDPNVGLTAEAIDTEVAVLNSPELAEAVVKKLNLAADPEFNKAVRESSQSLSAEERLGAVTQAVLRNLDVRREKLTYVIGVAFKSRDAGKSAQIANAFATTYIDTRVGTRASTAEKQAQWFAEQLARLATEVQTADAKVAQYRASAGIVRGGENGTITDQQVAPLSTQLANAQSDAAEARAKLAEARRQVAAGGLDAVSAVRTSTVVGDLRRQRAEIVRNMGEITSRYGDRHPETIKVRQQLKEIDAQITDEANRALNSLQADADAAAARAGSLGASLTSLRSQQAVDTRASVIAESLERDAANKRAAYDKMAQMRLEAVQSARNVIANAEIIDAARDPLKPAAPRKPLLLGLAALVSVALGFGFIVVQELFARGLRTVSDVEQRLRMPLLASIPRVSLRKGASPADSLIDTPASIYAEAIRNARASILGVRASERARVVAITSAVPEEGKTTLALSLARMLSLNGTRTLLIDCDLRRAALLGATGAAPNAGVVEVLQGEATLEDAIVADRVDKLDLLLVERKLFTAEDLFGDSRMSALVDRCKQIYDVVLLDLPPVMGVADARTLAVLADTTVLAVRWGSTPGRACETAVNWLRSDGARVAGAVYTIVDPQSEAIGGLFYSGKYAVYYQQA